MLAEVEKMKAAPVPADELSKAVKQFISGTLSSRKTMQGQAQDLGGSWLAANDLNFSERYLAAVKRVTPADLQRVAAKYLTPENRTLYSLLPTGTAPKPSLATETSREHPVQKFELPNGLRLLVKEDHRLPFVEFRTVFKGGVLVETAEKNGLTQLTGKLLLKGTARRSAEDIAREIESVGGSIDSYGGNNSFGVNAEVLSDDFATGLDLLADVLLNPTFPAPALEREREVQLGRHPRPEGPPAPERLAGHAPRAVRPERAMASTLSAPSPACKASRSPTSRPSTPNSRAPTTASSPSTATSATDQVKAAVEKAFATWQSLAPGGRSGL